MIGPQIESLFVITVVMSKVAPSDYLPRFYWPIILMNVYTIIITQLLVYDLKVWLDIGMIAHSIEVFTIVVEFFFLRWLFKRLYRQGMFQEPISPIRLLTAVFIANAVTHGLGFLLDWSYTPHGGAITPALLLPTLPTLSTVVL